MSWRQRLAMGAFLATGCSLVSTGGLTGGADVEAECTGSSCHDAAADAPLVEGCTAETETGTDSANCGRCGNVCASGMRCSSGACVPGCRGGVLYVSGSGGSDRFDGCSKDKPKETLGAALALVHATPTEVSEIDVCRGTYIGADFALDVPVSMHGGFDCVLWERTATYGYPTFDGRNATILQPSPANITGITMTIGGATLGRNVQFDGFRVFGPAVTPAPNVSSEALDIVDLAAVDVHDNEILGAAQSSTDTRGLNTLFSASPNVHGNHIDGGGGDLRTTAVTIGSKSTPVLHDNLITSGSSSGGLVAGVRVFADGGDLVGPYALTGNTIEAGAGIGIPNFPASIGVYANRPIEILGNTITAGQAACDPSVVPCASIGVYSAGQAASTDTLVVAGNRIVGGSSSSATGGVVIGINVQAMGPALLVNNAVHAGATAPITAQAIRLSLTTNAVIDGNTLFGSDVAIGLDPSSNALARNNLFLGSTTGHGAFRSEGCPHAVNPPLVDFRGNGFVDFPGALGIVSTASGSACMNNAPATFTDLMTAVPAAANNVRLASSCPSNDAPTCVAAPTCTASSSDAASCITTVLAAWDDGSNGVQTLLDNTQAWQLGANAPCAIAHGGVALTDGALADAGADARADAGATLHLASVTVDIAGRPRTTPVSIGAYEDDGVCR